MKGRVWVLDTETKGTGAQMVPLDSVVKKPERVREPPVVRKRRAKPAPEPPARRPRRFRVVDIATRLADQLRVLRPVGGATGGRHGSLAAALAAAVDRLTPAERVLFARLAVFADTFPLAAAEAVGGPEALDVVHRLDLERAFSAVRS